MKFAFAPSSFGRLRPAAARAVLAVAALLTIGMAAVTISPLGNNQAHQAHGRPSDVALYRAEVDRMAAGEGYYEAAGAELRARGYPTRSVFNWRMPLPLYAIGRLPSPELAKALLGGLALLAMLLTFEAFARETERASTPGSPLPMTGEGIVAALLLTGPLMLCILGDLFVMPVLWAGVLIVLSIGCYGVGRPGWGVVFAIAALFVRELALPYCALGVALAWQGRRRDELLAWGVGLTAWAAYFAVHAWQVAALVGPNDVAHPHGWLRFGGLGFVLATVQINAYLLLLPQWLTALFFAAALLGLAGWDTPWGRRAALTAAIYVAAFGFVGQEFNQYWGALVAPLWCLGVARFPSAVGDLVASAMPTRFRVCSSSST
jgi:hypothetical protein